MKIIRTNENGYKCDILSFDCFDDAMGFIRFFNEQDIGYSIKISGDEVLYLLPSKKRVSPYIMPVCDIELSGYDFLLKIYLDSGEIADDRGIFKDSYLENISDLLNAAEEYIKETVFKFKEYDN